MPQFELKEETRELGGINFTVVQFPAMKALEVMVVLQNMTPGASPDTDLSTAARAAMSKMDPKAMKQMVLDVLQCTTAHIPGTTKLIPLTSQKEIDQVFSGKLKLLFEVIGFAIEVNYGDFKEGSEGSAPLIPTPSL